MTEFVVERQIRVGRIIGILLIEGGLIMLLSALTFGRVWHPDVTEVVGSMWLPMVLLGVLSWRHVWLRSQSLAGTKITFTQADMALEVDLLANSTEIEFSKKGQPVIHYEFGGLRHKRAIFSNASFEMIAALEAIATQLPPERVIDRRTARKALGGSP